MAIVRSAVLSVAVLLGAATGCNRPSPPSTSETLPAETLPAVRVVDGQELNEILGRQRGEVVLVDYWATWCAPCVEMFPHTVELHKRFGRHGLVVMAVSLDDPDDLPGVQRFLASQGAAFENYISRYGAGTKSLEAFGIGGRGLPVLRIYDHRGRLQKTFGAGEAFAPSDVDQAVTKALELREPLGSDPPSGPEQRPVPSKSAAPSGTTR